MVTELCRDCGCPLDCCCTCDLDDMEHLHPLRTRQAKNWLVLAAIVFTPLIVAAGAVLAR